MVFNQKTRKLTTFGELKRGEMFIVRKLPDSPVEPLYNDCLCMKVSYRVAPGFASEMVAANLTYKRIENFVDMLEVERIEVEINEL